MNYIEIIDEELRNKTEKYTEQQIFRNLFFVGIQKGKFIGT